MPVRVGVASSVTPLLPIKPLMEPESSVTSVTTGASGASVSTIISQLSDMSLLPVPSDALTVNLWVPSASGEDGVNDQLPLASIVTWPISTPLSKICNVAFAGPVPWRVGVLSLVDPC